MTRSTTVHVDRRGDTGGDNAHQRWLALVGAQTGKTLKISAHWRWLAPGGGLRSRRSQVRILSGAFHISAKLLLTLQIAILGDKHRQ